jgi:hypothetical protein
MNDKFILEGQTPIECPDLMEWGQWMQTADRHVDKTMVGDVKVSTVFLGLDHRFGDEDRPILFETMIFGGEHDQFQERYDTWE